MRIKIRHMAKKIIASGILIPIILLTLLFSVPSPNSTIATPDEVRWSRVNIPAEGNPGDWVLASGSDIRHLTMASDGTLYCYANPSGTSYTLFKSTDGGYRWSYTGGVQGAMVDIATAPGDANTVYYASTSDIYKSIDAGVSFTTLPSSPGGAGSNNVIITSIDVTHLDNNNTIAVSTKDNDSSEYGGVYVLDEGLPSGNWTDSNIGNYDVSGVAFSPNYSADRQLLAVATDETDTLVTTKISDSDWGVAVADAIITGLVATSAAIAFPDDYNLSTEGCTLFAAIDAGSNNGDVYKVSRVSGPDRLVATDLNIGSSYGPSNVDVTTVAVAGNAASASLLAGSATSGQVYKSTDGGSNWTRSSKEPTGQSKTYVLMASDFMSQGRAYASTSGTESGFSLTPDGGTTWNQLSLIDNKISSIVDLAVSPNYAGDNTLFMLTFDGDHTEHSLWRSLNRGTTWERLFSSTPANIDNIKLVNLSPQYGYSSQVMFLAGTSNGNPAIWKSTDSGQRFTVQSAPLAIDKWAVVDDDILFIGGYDGNNGLVYRKDTTTSSNSTGVEAGNQTLNSIVLSPDFEQDKTIMVGNTTGQVYRSDDNGASFEALGQQLPLSAGVGKVTIAFDPRFGTNNAVYAASDAQVTAGSNERIYRFVIGRSVTWESIDNTLPDNAMINQLVVSSYNTLYGTTNTLYAANSQSNGGMERTLNPAIPLNQTFETTTQGLDDNATLTGLWVYSNQLWSIDSTNITLVTYTDSLSMPVVLGSPPNEATSIETRNVSLTWAGPWGATEYEWQVDYETDFSSVPDEFEGSIEGQSKRLPSLEPATTYYWRVRATKPVLSPWSAMWSFTTVLGGTGVAPELLSPEAGDNLVPVEPIFQWSVMAGADGYELLVATDVSFNSPIIAKTGDDALAVTVWQSDIGLDWDTVYYWKVRACSSNNFSAWSTISAFTTESKPERNPSTDPESSSSDVITIEIPPLEIPPIEMPAIEIPPIEIPPIEIPTPQFVIPNWATYSVIGLLATVALLLVVLLVVMIRIRRY
jgi:hypothetical protein